MTFIVMDLEWNQPLSYNSSAYKQVEGKLLFELIQIGAVKLNDKCEVISSFSQLIQPKHYVKIHPRIKRITHIEQEQLDEAPYFEEALENFEKWCGEDYVLLTWGCDDISVLNQNITFFDLPNNLGKIYDLQRLFGDIIGNSKERKGLKSAMEYYQIEPDDNMPFHNAMHDAYYTALVFSKFPDPKKVLLHPLTPKKLTHIDKRNKACVQLFRTTKNIEECLKSPAALNPACPICGKKYALETAYLKEKDMQYTALSVCKDHGLLFVKLHFKKDENNKKVMERSISVSDEQHKAYISTKILQWQNKVKKQQAL